MDQPIIEQDKLYLVTDITGYTPNISRLICMMNYARYTTLGSVKGLTVEQLDYLHDKESNSIGALLYHIASTDFYFRILTFEERELTPEEDKKWEAASYLGEKGRELIKGNDLKFYVNILNEERNKVYELLKEKDDEWLEKKMQWYGNTANFHHIWFHAFEDEINHRGQISWLRKRLKSQA
ncbi:MAG: DUF664 domain-containing protein [Ignavibacteria bacterium]|nr:DUF664 domain-containing protein [Ignavibacteria bacterium]